MSIPVSAIAFFLLSPLGEESALAAQSGIPFNAPVKKISRAECMPLDLRSRFGPIRDQTGIGGMCYALVGADLISEALSLQPQQISALQLSAVYFTSSEAQLLAVGRKELGERFVHELVNMPLGNRPSGGNSIVAMKLYAAHGRTCTEGAVRTEPTPEQLHSMEPAKRKSWLRVRLEANYFPITDSVEIRNLPPEAHHGAAQRLRENLDLACSPEPRLQRLRFFSWETPMLAQESDRPSRETQLQLLRHIQERLAKRKPLGFGWNGCDFLSSGCSFERKYYGHESIVVGRRWRATGMDSGQCEVLVRNSYGTQENSCVNGAICERGHLWVPLEKLLQSITGIEWVDLPD